MNNALSRLKRKFPNLQKVIEGKKDVVFEVLPADVSGATLKSHDNCPAARACMWETNASEVIISKHFAYLISGRVATRYFVPPVLQAQIVKFDRSGKFQTGEYRLKAPSKCHTLNYIRMEQGKWQEKFRKGLTKRHRHHITTGIRTKVA